MKVLVTGSSGHLGEALVRTLRGLGQHVVGLDIVAGELTTHVGSIADRSFVRRCIQGATTVFHSATLHKPHLATHSRQEFIDTNVTGTLTLLEESAATTVDSFIFTSTTSVFGDALVPQPGEPSAWITEDTIPVPRNIYGVTKFAAENLCQLFHRNQGLACVVLRTSRFFPEEDDNPEMRQAYADANLKANEFLYRRVEIDDVVQAHLLAAQKAPALEFHRYIISATSPFTFNDVHLLQTDAPAVVSRYVPEYQAEYARREWRMLPSIDRVYINALARRELGWKPQFDFKRVVSLLRAGHEVRSSLATSVGSKGYHAQKFDHGPYPVAS